MRVDVVTPARRIVEGETTSQIRLPGARGEMQVLEGHAELLSTLSTGIMEFNGRKFAISHGFVEVRNEKVTVLAETCEEAHEIDLARAKQAQQTAQEKLQGTLSDEEFRKYELKLQRAMIRQQLAGRA